MADPPRQRSNKGNEKAVVVICGSWVSKDDGAWDFVMTPGWMSRVVLVSEEIAYADLQKSVQQAFGFTDFKPHLSFWLPSELSIFSSRRRPPVVIHDDNGVRFFLQEKALADHLNLLITIDEPPFSRASNIQNNRGTTYVAKSSGHIPSINPSTENTENETMDAFIDRGRIVFRSVSTSTSEEQPEWRHLDSRGQGTPPNEDSFADLEAIIRLADDATPERNKIGENEGTREQGIPANTSTAAVNSVGHISRCPAVIPFTDKGKGIPEDAGGSRILRMQGTPDSYSSNLNENHEDQTCGVLGGEQHPLLYTGANVQGYERGESSRPVRNVRESEEIQAEELDDAIISEQPHRDITEDIFQYCKDAANVTSNLTRVFNELREAEDIATEVDNGCYDDGNDIEFDRKGAIIADGDLCIGRIFPSKGAFQTALSLYAIKKQCTFHQKKSDTQRVIAVCFDSSCPWRVYARAVSKNADHFEIRTLDLRHTCSIATRAQYVKKATATIIAEVLKGRYINGKKGPRASEIPELMLEELKVSIPYSKAWKGKEKAILKARGSDEESFKLLAVYMHLLRKANPGTVYDIVGKPGKKGEQQFKYMFLALGPSIDGIKYMRQVVVVDATAIRAKFKGCLLSACMQDGNFQVFPIAFAVVDGENDSSWQWFFSKLKEIMPDSPDLVIVSDRHRSIYSAIAVEYPNAFHGACAVHIERNVKTKFRVRGLHNLVGKAARAFTVGEFKDWISEIARRSAVCTRYLADIPLEHWTQAYCPAKRYNIMSSNIAESWNAAVGNAITQPIVGLVETLRMKLMTWFCVRRAEAEAERSVLTKNANDYLVAQQRESAGLNVLRASVFGFQVIETNGNNYYVDLRKKECSCTKFTKMGLPCTHAMAAARFISLDAEELAEEVYHNNFRREAYSKIIYPIRNISDEDVPETVEEDDYSQPDIRRGAGRPRKRRYPSGGEQLPHGTKKARRCTLCSETGHNRATCDRRPN